MFLRVLLLLSMLLGVSGLEAETVTGQVFRKDSGRKELLYTYKNEITTVGDVQKSNAQFLDLNGQPVVMESSERQGTKLIRFEVDHRQTGRKGIIQVQADKVSFNFEENGSKKGVETEKLVANFVVPHTLTPYVTNHWKELMGGQSVDIRFGVWDRRETVGFSLFKVGQEKLDGKDVILLKFKPTSFVIAALVDPVIFKYSLDGTELLSMVGRVSPKQKKGDQWKDLDAEVIYKITP